MKKQQPTVKILVAYHKPAPIIEDDVFIPVNAGRSILKEKYLKGEVEEETYQWLMNNTIGDDTGDNISHLNNQYNELSIVYWAWKNYNQIGNPDFIGLSHYRRHFIFSEFKPIKSSLWTVNFPYYSKEYLKALHLEKIDAFINQNDCLYAAAHTPNLSVYEQYGILHDASDLEFILTYIKKKYPSYYSSAYKNIYGNHNYFCNMFILKKEYFFQYCVFIFDVLKYYLNYKNYSEASIDEKRFYISERITGIFIQHLIDLGVKANPLNISLLENTEIKHDLYPISAKNNIPVVFALDEKYANMFSVALASLIEHSSEEYNYDIIVLNNDIKKESKEKLLFQCKKKNNIYLRFLNIQPYLSDLDLKQFYIEIHVSLATYYRFFIPEIFKNFKKILYCDCDIIINRNIAELYKVELNDCWIGATKDIRESIPVKLSMNVSHHNWRSYVKDILGLKNPYEYFQAGILLFNIPYLIKSQFTQKCLLKLNEIKRPILSDQDILNAVCYKHVYFFPVNWNLEWQISFEFPNYEKVIKADLYEQYSQALKEPYIIHYASSKKPVNYNKVQLSEYFWKYARQTPFYEEILSQMIRYQTGITQQSVLPTPHIICKQKYKLFNFIPLWSRRFSDAKCKYKLFGLPLFSRKIKGGRTVYKFCGIPVWKIRRMANNITTKYYFCGIPLLKVSKK